MDIKKHYKILIAILIVIVLISSFIIYDITTKNNITYNNNGKPVDLKYYNNVQLYNHIPGKNYSISSSYIKNNKISYLNSTIVCPWIYPIANYYCLAVGVNIHLYNINDKNMYIELNGKTSPNNIYPTNAKVTKTICKENLYLSKLNIINYNRNITLYMHIPVSENICNVSMKIGLNNHFYNLFDISIIKETAIYGCIINLNNLTTDKINTELLIENMNNSNYKIIHIVNGYYYCFLKPDTEYKLYSIEKNNTLNLLYTISNLIAGTGFNHNISASDL